MPSPLLRAYAASVAFAFAPAHAFAQSPSAAPAVLDPIVVTASRTPQPLLEIVADVTVIDAD